MKSKVQNKEHQSKLYEMYGKFGAVPIAISKDQRITLNAIKVFITLSSFQGTNESCNPSHVKIAERSGLSLSAVYRAIKLLDQTGWIEKIKKYNRKNDEYICNTSKGIDIGNGNKRKQNKFRNSDSSLIDDSSFTGNLDSSLIDEPYNIKDQLKDQYDFDRFWIIYDKKVGPINKIKKKWNSLSSQTKQEILDYIPKYKEAQPDKMFRKNPKTFLDQKGWQDEIILQKTITTKFDLSKLRKTHEQGY